MPTSIEAFFFLSQDGEDVHEHDKQTAMDVQRKFIRAFALSEGDAPPLVRFHVDKWDAPFESVTP